MAVVGRGGEDQCGTVKCEHCTSLIWMPWEHWDMSGGEYTDGGDSRVTGRNSPLTPSPCGSSLGGVTGSP